MDQTNEDRINEELAALMERVESVTAQNSDLSRMLMDANRRIDELSSELELMKSEAVSENSEDESDDDSPPSKELSVVTSAAKNVEDHQVIIPDAHVWSSQATRKSIEWAPEMANITQLNEFDDAPSVGTIHLVASVSGSSGGSSGSGQTVTLKLVDPDGNTAEEDTSMKWMVPLRQADGNGKVLHWARIGNSVTFDVGSIIDMPCPPTIDATLSGNSVVVCVHSYEKVDGDCVEASGSPECVTIPLNEFNLNCEDVRNCISGATETVVTDVFVSGDGNLYKTVRTAKALEWGSPSNVMIVSGTTCEEGGTS